MRREHVHLSNRRLRSSLRTLQSLGKIEHWDRQARRRRWSERWSRLRHSPSDRSESARQDSRATAALLRKAALTGVAPIASFVILEALASILHEEHSLRTLAVFKSVDASNFGGMVAAGVGADAVLL